MVVVVVVVKMDINDYSLTMRRSATDKRRNVIV